MKKIWIIFFSVLSFLFINVYASSLFAVDEGKLLKEDTVSYINTYSSYLKKVANVDYYVITIDKADEKDLDLLSDITYSKYINNKYDNGLLIFVCKHEREVKVIAGKGLSEIITDDIINKYIQEYFISYLSNNEWDSGIRNGYTAFFKYICLHLNIDTSGLEVKSGNDFLFKYRYYVLFICVWICNVIGYILPKYFIRLFNKNYKVNTLDNIIFYVSVFVNVLILYYNYTVMKEFLFVIFLFELFSILSGTVLNPNNKSSKKRKKKKKKK